MVLNKVAPFLAVVVNVKIIKLKFYLNKPHFNMLYRLVLGVTLISLLLKWLYIIAFTLKTNHYQTKQPKTYIRPFSRSFELLCSSPSRSLLCTHEYRVLEVVTPCTNRRGGCSQSYLPAPLSCRATFVLWWSR